MQVFINECSLHAQYNNKFEFIESLRIFIKALKVINECDKDKAVFKSSDFFYSEGLSKLLVESALKSDPTLNRLFFENFQKLNPKTWQKIETHDYNSSYEYLGVDYVTKSCAELAERKFSNQGLIGLLLNFSKSVFGDNSSIEINKNKSGTVIIDCAIDESDIGTWLITNKLIKPEYDENSKIVPLDCQTVLYDTDIFELTNYPKNNGRKVYRKKDSDQLWVVDSSSRHAGKNAHIEVFDYLGNHLGTSLYNLIALNVAYKKKGRTLNMG